MNPDNVIKADHVSKKYCKSLRDSMFHGFSDIGRNLCGLSSHSDKLRKGEFWAVDDVSFEIKKGEALGIIGPNGSGKSTILKMLNGIFWPDKGKISVKGKIGALIEVGAGFHPLLTGRENVYVNGAILGMTKQQIDDKFSDIVKFADIGDFIDTPVKSYSSGMFVRLGFAVAVHSGADILLVDEVLAVGDKEFQTKCYQKMFEIRKQGATVILVSHNEYAIRETTKNCLYIDGGKVRFLGSSEEGINAYLKDILENRVTMKSAHPQGNNFQALKKANILSVKFFDYSWREISFIESGEELNIVLEFELKSKIENPIFGINFYDNTGFMYCANSDYENVAFEKIPLSRAKIKINVPSFHLPINNYVCSAIIAEESVDNLVDWHDMVYRLTVGRARNARGSIKLPTKWTIESCQ